MNSHSHAPCCECAHVVGERTRIRFKVPLCILFQILGIDFAPSENTIKFHRHLLGFYVLKRNPSLSMDQKLVILL